MYHRTTSAAGYYRSGYNRIQHVYRCTYVLVLLGIDVLHLSSSLVVVDNWCRLLVKVLQAVPELIRRVVGAAHEGLASHLDTHAHTQENQNKKIVPNQIKKNKKPRDVHGILITTAQLYGHNKQ